MNPSFSPAEEAFRLRLRRWLEANPPDVRGHGVARLGAGSSATRTGTRRVEQLNREIRPLAIVLGAVTLFGLAIVGCESGEESGKTSEKMEERMREIEKRVKESMPKTQQIALAQKVDPAVVKQAQEQLKTLKEYFEDPPSGKIDMVTVNAIEAFQRRVGLRDDGLLDDETRRRLDDAAKNAETATKTSAG